MTSINDPVYDLIIAGGGPAGVLAALRAAALHKGMRILLLEKEAWLGGRMRSTSEAQHRWGYGFSSINQKTFDFWNHSLQAVPGAPDLKDFSKHHQLSGGVLAGSKVSEFSMPEWFAPKGARALGGLAAARGWDQVEKMIQRRDVESSADSDSDSTDEDGPDKAVHQVWKGTRKDPAAVVLEHFAYSVGISDVWNSSSRALMERAPVFSQGRMVGVWEEALEKSLECLGSPNSENSVETVKNCRIVSSQFQQDCGVWTIETERGDFQAKRLIVAQSPWVALDWLAKEYWPTSLMNVLSKTRPTSVVTLTEKVLLAPTNETLNDVLLIPAEQTTAIYNPVASEICYQAVLDFELSLQAPAVVKAVKQLKRASRKLHGAFPDLKTAGEHIALVPVAWALSTAHSDRRFVNKLSKSFNSPHLMFCGDSYGSSYDAEENFVSSLTNVSGDLEAGIKKEGRKH